MGGSLLLEAILRLSNYNLGQRSANFGGDPFYSETSNVQQQLFEAVQCKAL
jgi:hypothetical protein